MESWREQPERVPAVPPGFANTISGVEDHEIAVLSCQVVAHCETGLAAADHDGVEMFLVGLVCHGCSSLDRSVEKQGGGSASKWDVCSPVLLGLGDGAEPAQRHDVQHER
jgi:hypothetical protein